MSTLVTGLVGQTPGALHQHAPQPAVVPLPGSPHTPLYAAPDRWHQPAQLRAGRNELTVEVVGKDVHAAGYSGGHLDGIEGLLLRR